MKKIVVIFLISNVIFCSSQGMKNIVQKELKNNGCNVPMHELLSNLYVE